MVTIPTIPTKPEWVMYSLLFAAIQTPIVAINDHMQSTNYACGFRLVVFCCGEVWSISTASFRVTPLTLRQLSDYNCYRQSSDISRTLVGSTIVDHSDEVGARSVGAAPTTSSFSTEHLISLDWAKTTAKRDTFKFWDLARLILDFGDILQLLLNIMERQIWL